MIKKGFDLLFTTVDWNTHLTACKACEFPFKRLCKHICKFRKATLEEALDYEESRYREALRKETQRGKKK